MRMGRLFFLLFIPILVFFLASCSEQKNLDADQVAMVNGHIITVKDVESQLKFLQLEKQLYEYNRFRNNIYPKLELLNIRPSLVDDIILLIQQGKLDEARAAVQNLAIPEDKNTLKYFVLKEIDSYERLLKKQTLLYAFQQTLAKSIIMQELEARNLIPSSSEIDGAYLAYQTRIREDIESNIFYQYYYQYAKAREMDLFELETEESYKNHMYEKIKQELSKEKFKKAIGTYRFEDYIEEKLKKAEIVFNKQYEQYKKETQLP
ncbi:hypothetical protein [Geosporobacter ferrireducens]|uniref:Uncharacterized protein n=1 Tax=Geosporobacter ferrireducens TaxID=1424294 RepID=A0A1D8GHQ1_9FIRM|nr:hypothetical protein [Geosporobacter ferrireducens]AOT70406.1 hypothetical protein Gferi_12940 [Geosporobacter ferrireducens]MTI58153.1 hypothetical protein [Geosporobacter ferrireducens]